MPIYTIYYGPRKEDPAGRKYRKAHTSGSVTTKLVEFLHGRGLTVERNSPTSSTLRVINPPPVDKLPKEFEVGAPSATSA